jgi:hypothetical protein
MLGIERLSRIAGPARLSLLAGFHETNSSPTAAGASDRTPVTREWGEHD